MPYTFPGVWPFIERIAAESGRDLHQAGRSRQIWHVGQVQDALGQIVRLDPKSQRASLEHVRKTRDSLALALEGVDAAIAEVVARLDIEPEQAPSPKPKRTR